MLGPPFCRPEGSEISQIVGAARYQRGSGQENSQEQLKGDLWGCSSVVERLVRIQEAVGSIPTSSNVLFAHFFFLLFSFTSFFLHITPLLSLLFFSPSLAKYKIKVTRLSGKTPALRSDGHPRCGVSLHSAVAMTQSTPPSLSRRGAPWPQIGAFPWQSSPSRVTRRSRPPRPLSPTPDPYSDFCCGLFSFFFVCLQSELTSAHRWPAPRPTAPFQCDE